MNVLTGRNNVYIPNDRKNYGHGKYELKKQTSVSSREQGVEMHEQDRGAGGTRIKLGQERSIVLEIPRCILTDLMIDSAKCRLYRHFSLLFLS